MIHNPDVKEVKLKLARYCAYRDRSEHEVRTKLSEFWLPHEQVEAVIHDLVEDGFINDKRFAISYAQGKFNANSWGKIKITKGLETHGVAPEYIHVGLASLDEVQYRKRLKELLKGKWDRLSIDDIFVKKHRAAHFLIGKGFEPSLVWQMLEDMN